MCNLNIKHVNKTHVCLQYHLLHELCIEHSNRNCIKTLNRKSDREFEILEKLVKTKQILLNSYFGCSSCFNEARKTKKTSSSVPRFLEYKTVEENWIEESLALFNARIWLYDKDGEYATNLLCKVCTQFREHIERIKYFKENWITGLTNYHSPNAINKKKVVLLLV